MLGARWSEINLDARMWTVPAERMKNGKEHRVPLSDAALAVLGADAGIPASSFEGNRSIDALVFARPDGKPLPSMAMRKVLHRMGVAVTCHGMRASFRNFAAEQTSFPYEVCEQALAHVIGDSTQRAYLRSDLFEKRRALMTAWSAFLAGA